MSLISLWNELIKTDHNSPVQYVLIAPLPCMDHPRGSVETEAVHHTEYFHCDSANLTPGVLQQTGVKLKKTEDRSLWAGACQVRAGSLHLFTWKVPLGLIAQSVFLLGEIEEAECP